MHADNTKTSPITIITYTHIYVLVFFACLLCPKEHPLPALFLFGLSTSYMDESTILYIYAMPFFFYMLCCFLIAE